MDNPVGGIVRGWAAVRQVYAKLVQGPAKITVEFYDYTLHEAGDVLYAVGRERGTLSVGGRELALGIRTTRVFRRRGTVWRQVHHHGSMDTRERPMAEQPTCGKGLAANAMLPATLGDVTAALGAILEAHIPSLDLTDERSRKEREVYQRLAEDCRRTGVQLEAIAQLMGESRDLPMGRHDLAAIGSPSARHSFRSFVEAEQKLLTLLQSRLDEDQRMLAAMGAPG